MTMTNGVASAPGSSCFTRTEARSAQGLAGPRTMTARAQRRFERRRQTHPAEERTIGLRLGSHRPADRVLAPLKLDDHARHDPQSCTRAACVVVRPRNVRGRTHDATQPTLRSNPPVRRRERRSRDHT
jgi:hypothetical protein